MPPSVEATTSEPSVLDKLKALSHEIRFKSVQHLAQGEHCVCELCDLLGLAQPTVSYHLNILCDAKLVTYEQRGKNVFYVLRQDQLFSLGGEVLIKLFAPTSPSAPEEAVVSYNRLHR